MHDNIIIADTSSLIALNNIGELNILAKLYSSITITQEIIKEYGLELPNWIKIEKVSDEKKFRLLNLQLDEGESSAIALALEKDNSLLIIDERKGRATAKSLGISITGILGVILKAKELKYIDRVEPILHKLENVDFRMSGKLKNKILAKSQEFNS